MQMAIQASMKEKDKPWYGAAPIQFADSNEPDLFDVRDKEPREISAQI